MTAKLQHRAQIQQGRGVRRKRRRRRQRLSQRLKRLQELDLLRGSWTRSVWPLNNASWMKWRRSSSKSLHKTAASVTLDPSCTTISLEHFRSVRCQMAELTNNELDLVVMGQVMAGCFTGERSSHREQERGKSYTVFYHQGIKICQKTFLFLHAIGYGRFKAIKASYLTRGVAARVHGNKGKSTKFRLSLQEIQDVVQYVMNYAGVYVCSEMGRVSECMCVCVCVRERERE